MIFVDTSFWVALAVARDDRHRKATELFERHGQFQLITSNHVRGEVWTFLNRRHGHREAVRFLDFVSAGRLAIEHVSAQIETRSLAWLRQHDEREYSFVDATSFELMRSLGIREALAFDGDFAAAGFVELRADA